MAEGSDGRERASFREVLVAASGAGRSGVLKAYTGEEEIGMAVLVGGSLAWATCVDQPEDLGTFLVRLGHVSREDLAGIRAEYDRHQGRRKLGSLMENAGLVTSSVLRSCLLRHIRLALACMARRQDLEGAWQDGSFAVDEKLTFRLREVMPEWEPAFDLGAEGVRVHQVTDDVGGFEALRSTPGYRGAIIAGSMGEALAVHGFEEHGVERPSLLGSAALDMLEASGRSAVIDALGRLEAVYLEGTAGSVVARWLDAEHRLLIALFLEPESKIGSVRQRLVASLGSILDHVRAWGVPSASPGSQASEEGQDE